MIVTSEDTADNVAKLDGIICLGTFSKGIVERIRGFHKPAVFIDAVGDVELFDSIVVNLKHAVTKVMDYLVDAGHEKIALSEDETWIPMEKRSWTCGCRSIRTI